ncbi:hypothetical protein ACFSQ0_10365 [Mesonia sediminis]|uniref:Uncharacterized protein n=1 Tax=Mesonia sediminis TaxID=1703946 RepID=A0ABW5SF82_9FLAO
MKEEVNDNQYKDFTESQPILDFKFPDTVLVGSLVEGEIKYDTFQYLKRFGENTICDNQVILLYLLTNQSKKELNLKDIDKSPHRKIIIDKCKSDKCEDGKFFFSLIFNETGYNTIHGVINENLGLYLENDSELKYTTRNLPFSKDVFVKKNE